MEEEDHEDKDEDESGLGSNSSGSVMLNATITLSHHHPHSLYSSPLRPTALFPNPTPPLHSTPTPSTPPLTPASSPTLVNITPEQRRRSEQNRLAAINKLRLKQTQQQGHLSSPHLQQAQQRAQVHLTPPGTPPIVANNMSMSITPEQRERMERNRLAAIERQRARLTQQQQPTQRPQQRLTPTQQVTPPQQLTPPPPQPRSRDVGDEGHNRVQKALRFDDVAAAVSSEGMRHQHQESPVVQVDNEADDDDDDDDGSEVPTQRYLSNEALEEQPNNINNDNNNEVYSSPEATMVIPELQSISRAEQNRLAAIERLKARQTQQHQQQQQQQILSSERVCLAHGVACEEVSLALTRAEGEGEGEDDGEEGEDKVRVFRCAAPGCRTVFMEFVLPDGAANANMRLQDLFQAIRQ